MKNLFKRTSQKVNVSECGGTLDCTDKNQINKKTEVYKAISEDSLNNQQDKSEKLENPSEGKVNQAAEEGEKATPSSSATSTKSADSKSEESLNSVTSDSTKMVQEQNHDGADEQMLGADDEKLAVKREEVKFIKGDQQNGDAKIDIGAINGKAFTGMSKEELMKYANDPFWVRLRWIFFISFWLIWAGMLVGAILIIIGAPKCAAPEPLPWYKSGILAKFSGPLEVKPTDVEQVQKIKANGVIYEIPVEDTYNIGRQSEVDEKIKSVIKHYKDSDINVIVDITANYVPKTSQLMQQALADESKRSAFVWMQQAQIPTNWISLRNTPAWTQVEANNYVLSQFGEDMFDLHMNDTIVKKELSNVLRHLIEMGVQGIRLKNTKFFLLSKVISNDDEDVTRDPRYKIGDYGFTTHTHTTFQEGLGDVLYEYLAVVKNTSATAFLSVADDIMRPDIYKTRYGDLGIDIPMFGEFVKSVATPDNKNLRRTLEELQTAVGNGTWLQWNLGEIPDDSKVSHSAVSLFFYLLPGTPVVTAQNINVDFGNATEAAFKQLDKLRSSPSYMHGDFNLLDSADPLLAYTRFKSGNPGYLVVFNPTDVLQQGNFTSDEFSDKLTVITVSQNFNVTGIVPKAQIFMDDLSVSPYSTIILSYVPKKD